MSDKEVAVRTNVSIDPQALIASAIDKGTPIEVMEKLLNMRDRIRAEQAEMAFREAMKNFQDECPVIKKKKKVLNKNSTTERYRYAPLEDILKQVRPLLSKHGFSYTFTTQQDGTSVTVTCRAHHEAGHTEESSFSVPAEFEHMTKQQESGSALTYAKRYSFCNAFGIMTGDDDNDGNTGQTRDGDREPTPQEKLNALPDKIKDGMKANGITTVNKALAFCEAHKWNEETMNSELNKMADNA
ncbi:MAG TPA: ERF family protein [Dissulfurispiraceae bacterium]|nr:ERF family protein [Dissulfurispiraceae bacterium]